MNEGAILQHGSIGERVLEALHLGLHGEIHRSGLAGLHWWSQLVNLVVQSLIILGELRSRYLNRGLIIVGQREMDLSEGLRGLVHDALLTTHCHVSRFRIQVDGILHVRDPGLGLLFESLVSLLVVCLQAIRVVFASYRVQDLGVVKNPGARRDKADRSRYGYEAHGSMEAQPRVPDPAAPTGFTSTLPQQDCGRRQENTKHRPIQHEPGPTLDKRSVPVEIRVGHGLGLAELDQVSGDMQRRPDKSGQDEEGDISEVADVFVGRNYMNKKRQNGQKNEAEQVHSKQVRNVETQLVAVISVKELHQQRGAHCHSQNDYDAAHQGRKLGQVRGPLWIGERVVYFVGAAVPLLPRQNPRKVGDHRNQEQVKCPCNHLE